MNKYKTTLCKTTPYTDLNGVSWWDESLYSKQDIVDFWKKLEGYENSILKINKVYQEGDYIMAEVTSSYEGVENKYLNTSISCTLSKGKKVTAVESIELTKGFLVDEYSIIEAKPLTKVEEIKGE